MTGHDIPSPSASGGTAPLPPVDTTRPHPARIYDWFLGGKDNYVVDEEMGKQLSLLEPRVADMAVANRSFMRAATRWTAEQGTRQFLDVGTGIPTEPNLHQVAQSVAPESRVVYADNDPIVLRHAEALLRSTPEGVTEYVQADARKTESILEAAGSVLDFDRPVTLSLIALMHFISDEQGAYDIVRGLVEPLAPGSYLVLTQGTADFNPGKADDALDLYRKSGITMALRHRDGVERFFEGLEPLGPGVVPLGEWAPGDAERVPTPDGRPLPGWVGIARKN
ncbi:SAM-dependent methyltransferase [Streptomyces sp. NPDC049954]|uniref:SAM-dependent methyltransferase n=1 Tax=Streptomyces sp. NPDC049954 TaxID=3155779 RepID=UPI0034387941